jgi:hypothetical protein
VAGQASLLNLQLVSKRNHVGWYPGFIPALTQARTRKTKLAREGINYHSNRQSAADSFGKRWATTEEESAGLSGIDVIFLRLQRKRSLRVGHGGSQNIEKVPAKVRRRSEKPSSTRFDSPHF